MVFVDGFDVGAGGVGGIGGVIWVLCGGVNGIAGVDVAVTVLLLCG